MSKNVEKKVKKKDLLNELWLSKQIKCYTLETFLVWV